MTELNPPGFLQNRADHPARGLRSAISNLIATPGVVGATNWAVTQRAAGANMSVDIAGGAGYVAGTEAANQGYYHCVSDTTVVNKTVTASSGSQTRKDIVVARVYDTFYSGVSNLWQFEVIAGTFGSGTEPAVPANSYKIATIDIAISAVSIINTNITPRTQQFSLDGTPVPVANQAARDALTLAAGLQAYRLDTNQLQIYNGTSWFTIFDPVLNASDSGWLTLTLNSGGVAGTFTAVTGYTPLQYRKIGNRVTIRGMVIWTTGLLTNVMSTLPVGYRPAVNTWLCFAIGNTTSAVVQILVGASGTISIPSSSYYTGTPSAGMAIMVNGSFLVD